jgi:hypothetical protein
VLRFKQMVHSFVAGLDPATYDQLHMACQFPVDARHKAGHERLGD